jgi:hypothetical protein
MPYGNINVDTVTTSTQGGVLGAGNASIMKNRIINGAMVIDQRNAGASVTPTTSTYTLDRWNFQIGAASKLSVQQNAGSVTPPVGFKNYIGFTSTSAYTVGSAELFDIRQSIEGFNTSDLDFGTANAKTVTVSFWVRSSLTGTFGGFIANSAYNRVYVFNYTISSANTWEQKTVTITGDTTGTWIGATNGIGLTLSLTLAAGSAYQGSAGSWQAGTAFAVTGTTSVVGTNGATFYITGVQLEVGSSATGYEYVNYQTSLANCQRYYWRQYNAGYNVFYFRTYMPTGASSYNWINTMPAPPAMRTQSPTITCSATATGGTPFFAYSQFGSIILGAGGAVNGDNYIFAEDISISAEL